MAAATRPKRPYGWKSPWLVAIVAAIVVVVGGLGVAFATGTLHPPGGPAGPPSAVTPTPQSSAGSSPTQSRTPSPSVPVLTSLCDSVTGPAPGVNQASAAPPAAVVAERSGTDYTVSMVGLDGHTIASATAPGRTSITVDNKVAMQLPDVSVAGFHAFFLYGDNSVHYLSSTGSGVATTIPGGARAHAAFAVSSPNEDQIAVSVIDYSTNPPTSCLYVEDLLPGHNHGHHSVIFRSSGVYVWPVSFRDGRLILAVGQPFQQDSPNPYGATSGYEVIDPADRQAVATVCTDGVPTGPIVSAGTACYRNGILYAAHWDGSIQAFPGSTGTANAVMSPDGTIAAVDRSGSGALEFLNVSGASTGSASVYHYAGWIDKTDLLIGIRGAFGTTNYVMSLPSQNRVDVTASGTFVSAVPLN